MRKVSGHFRRIAQPQWGDPSPHLPRAPKPRSPAFASSRQLFQSSALPCMAVVRFCSTFCTGWYVLCLACYTHHVGWGKRGLPKLWIRRESRLLDRVMGSRFPLDGLWHIIRRHQYFDLDTFRIKIEVWVSRGLYPKPSLIALKHCSFMSCTIYSWVTPMNTFCCYFSRKFQDGRVEERAVFLTPLSLQGMSRIENNWGCLAQIGEIATTFGIVALWPHTCTFQLKRVAEQISEDSSRGFAARNAGRVGWKSEFWLVYAAHSCCCLCIASGIQNCIIHKSFQPIRASWGMHMSSNQNATAYIP